jgi:hypothetical protein
MRPEKRGVFLLPQQSAYFRLLRERLVQINRFPESRKNIQNGHVYGMFPAVGNMHRITTTRKEIQPVTRNYLNQLAKLQKKHGRHFPNLAQAKKFDRLNRPVVNSKANQST